MGYKEDKDRNYLLQHEDEENVEEIFFYIQLLIKIYVSVMRGSCYNNNMIINKALIMRHLSGKNI